MAKEAKLYRQDYCGCLFGLSIQRDQQRKLADELFVPLSGQIQPESIEERIALYERRIELEERGVDYRIVRERFLNWRLLHGLLRVGKEPVAAHILPYSTLRRDYTRGRIDTVFDGMGFLNRDEVKFLPLAEYNRLTRRDYASVTELIYAPPPFDEELELRRRLLPNPYDLSALLVVEAIPRRKLELRLESHTFEDVRERLIPLPERSPDPDEA
jgi:hypothetical protein